MILVDTSVWLNHFRVSSRLLAQLLDLEQVLIHPFVIGELACGNLANRKEIISLLQTLPCAPKVDDDEILFFVERHKLMGRGLGLVDVNLLASCMIGKASLWTADNRLHVAAQELGLGFNQQLASS